MNNLAIYYGYPSCLNFIQNNYNLDLVASDFAKYDMVILGAGLQNTSHPDHNNTEMILNKEILSDTEFYGYINAEDDTNILKSQVDDWHSLGIDGVLIDHAGYEFGITRSKQNELINYIHNKLLKVFIHTTNPDDIFAGTPVSQLNSNDWYLTEHYQIHNGNYKTEAEWISLSDKLLSYKNSTGVNIATIATSGESGFNQNMFDYAYYSTALYGFDAYCWGEYNYSAVSAVMPFRPRKQILGTKFTGDIIHYQNKHERLINYGIKINVSTYDVDQLLSE